jgi:hypothetical protein
VPREWPWKGIRSAPRNHLSTLTEKGRERRTLMIPLCPLVAATTCPHHRSLHQLKHQPPKGSFPLPGFGAPVEPEEAAVLPPAAVAAAEVPARPRRGVSSGFVESWREGRETVEVSCQSSREGERQVYIRRYESVEIVACARGRQRSAQTPNKERGRTSFNPNAFGANSIFLTLPLASISSPHSTHRFPCACLTAPADEDGVTCSQMRTERSYEHEARREVCSGCDQASWRTGASCACGTLEISMDMVWEGESAPSIHPRVPTNP